MRNDDAVGELVSRAAVTDLIHNFCLGFDRRDLNRFLGVWHEDGIWEYESAKIASAHGIDAIGELVQYFWGGFPRLRHLSSNVVVSVEGDAASALWDASVQFEDRSGVAWLVLESYTDEFRCFDGRWTTTRRVIAIEPQLEWSAGGLLTCQREVWD